MRQIRQGCACSVINYHRAQGHLDFDIFSLMPGAVFGSTIAAPLRHKFPFVPEIHQRIQVLVGHQNHRTAPAAIAPIGTAAGHIFFSAEAGGTIAARTRFHVNSCLIRKQHFTPLPFLKTQNIQYRLISHFTISKTFLHANNNNSLLYHRLFTNTCEFCPCSPLPKNSLRKF